MSLIQALSDLELADRLDLVLAMQKLAPPAEFFSTACLHLKGKEYMFFPKENLSAPPPHMGNEFKAKLSPISCDQLCSQHTYKGGVISALQMEELRHGGPVFQRCFGA